MGNLKMKEEHKFTIGYFGGSITVGEGASDARKTCWRVQVTDWLRQRLKVVDVVEIQGAIGGTGSDLGAYRCKHDLLAGKPDLIFIEFAVNDNGKDENLVLRSLEGIVRQILRADLSSSIIFVYTVTKEMFSDYESGGQPKNVMLHEKIADHYGIPSINVGNRLWESVRDGAADWEELLPDKVHPSDQGYKIYAEEIIKYLSENFEEGKVEKQLIKPLSIRPCENGHLVDAWKLYCKPWKKSHSTMAGRYPHMLVCNTAGAELEYRFIGRAVGLYWLIAPDSGDIEWSIDCSLPKRISSWDKYALKFTRANYCILNDKLEDGEHVLKLIVLKDKHPESTGNWIRIGAVLIE